MTLEEILVEARELPNDSKVLLVEKLVVAIESDSDKEISRSHLEEVKRRRNEFRSNKVQLVDGPKALAQIRAIL